MEIAKSPHPQERLRNADQQNCAGQETVSGLCGTRSPDCKEVIYMKTQELELRSSDLKVLLGMLPSTMTHDQNAAVTRIISTLKTWA